MSPVRKLWESIGVGKKLFKDAEFIGTITDKRVKYGKDIQVTTESSEGIRFITITNYNYFLFVCI